MVTALLRSRSGRIGSLWQHATHNDDHDVTDHDHDNDNIRAYNDLIDNDDHDVTDHDNDNIADHDNDNIATYDNDNIAAYDNDNCVLRDDHDSSVDVNDNVNGEHDDPDSAVHDSAVHDNNNIAIFHDDDFAECVYVLDDDNYIAADDDIDVVFGCNHLNDIPVDDDNVHFCRHDNIIHFTRDDDDHRANHHHDDRAVHDDNHIARHQHDVASLNRLE